MKPTASYEIHIRGRVGAELTAAFEGLQADVKPVETVLPGRSSTRPRYTESSIACRRSGWS